MEHYLRNTGDPINIDLGRFISETQNGKLVFYRELNEAMDLAETATTNNFEVVSQDWSNGTISKPDDANWYFAVASYKAFGRGPGRKLGCDEFILHFRYHFHDKYDWDVGKGVTLPLYGTITDKEIGDLHRVGLAQEFDVFGLHKKTVNWKRGQRFDEKTGELKDAPDPSKAKQNPRTSPTPRR